MTHAADLDGAIDKGLRHEKSTARRQLRIAAVRNRQLDEGVERAIETDERRPATVERQVSNASDE